MAFDDTCSQCAYLEPRGENKGKYPCTHPRSGHKVVSARMSKKYCDYYCAIGVGKRSTRECRELEANSRKHGYYIMTAIHQILDIYDTSYMSAFMYIKDEFMPMQDEYHSFLEDYEVHGPVLADILLSAEDKEEQAKYLMSEYLEEFTELVHLERPEEASTLYIRMYDHLLCQNNMVSTREKPKMLQIEGALPKDNEEK